MAKKAVLVGCNYPGTNAALRGCINDVWGMKELLTKYYGFAEADITILIDTDAAYIKPTGKNIKAELTKLVTNAQDGDEILFHFSGHGTQIPSAHGGEADGKDEAICPTDMNVICDDDLRALLKPLETKPGVKFTFVADCCHSGSMLDHAEVQISGPKDGSPPPPTFDMSALSGFLSALGNTGGRDFKNRSLPFNDLCAQLSALLGGAQVDARNVRSSVGQIFGADASQKVQQFMQIYQQFTSNAKMLGAPGGAGGAGGANAVAGILQLICSCLSPPAANQQQQQQYGAAPGAPASGTPANANTAPGSSYAAGPAAGNLPEPDLKINLPPAGAKPPAGQQLSKDVGILITGCQANETSADACPSGNPDKAHGALSNAIQTVVKQHFAQNPGQPLTYRNMVIGVRDLLNKTGFAQNPCLECDTKYADTPFIAH